MASKNILKCVTPSYALLSFAIVRLLARYLTIAKVLSHMRLACVLTLEIGADFMCFCVHKGAKT